MPHLPQKPASRFSGASHLAQKRLRSGTVGSSRIARSGSTDGRSGSVISPAPSCLRVVRELDREVRREPASDRLSGDEPVPVVLGCELMVPLRVGAVEAVASAEAAAGLFTAASPHTLQ